MCGISGIISKKYGTSDEVLLMNSLIRHRGPDGEGYLLIDNQNNPHCLGGKDTNPSIWSSNSEYSPTERIENLEKKDFKLAFGHRRLSILDLSPAGHQPMSFKEGRYWITFNGEIYNYQEIKYDLEKQGYVFRTKTDTEVVLAAYSEWGVDCLNKLAGMWAFAIYDRALNEIIFARDRYGIKPFYYWFSPGGCLYFASEIKQFTVCRDWKPKMNRQMAYDYLVYSFTDHTDETMFEGVYQLPSGSYFQAFVENIKANNSGRINYEKWYSAELNPFKGSFAEASTIFHSLFERSVSEHLNADVPVGSALSGGLDSSSIVCEVNRILVNSGKSELQQTFSSCAKNERYDERKWMEKVVNHVNVDAHYIYPSLNEALNSISELIWHHDEPYQSQSAFLSFSVFHLARKNGVKVLLNGQGADEYLGGYGQFTMARYAELIKRLRWFSLICDLRNLRRIRPLANSTILKGLTFHLLPNSLIKKITNYYSSSEYIKNLVDIEKLQLDFSHPFERIPIGLKTVSQISKHYTFYSTLPKYLRWEDRNSMANSVEARVPFLDHRLVEFCYNLPDDFLEKDGINKRIMREGLKGLMPEAIRNRKDKMGFTTPEEEWVRKDNPDYFRQLLHDSISLSEGIIKQNTIAYFNRVISGEAPFDYTYWRFILFGKWILRFHINL